jgi:hypothetical protein
MAHNAKKRAQLGMPTGTAANRLRKMLLWKYVVLAGDNKCFQCDEEIEDMDDVSMEHMVPWLDSDDPVGLYFGLDNVAFSHLSCNIRARRDYRTRKMVMLTCATCECTFERPAYQVTPKISVGQEDFYCSHKCSGHATGKGYGRREYE